MTGSKHDPSAAALSSARILADQTFARAAGAPLVPGNAIRILKDARENYPAWLDAIASARTTIHFETYIIHHAVWLAAVAVSRTGRRGNSRRPPR
jgi:phosphatidylserine/phosphatidylglycerophosphate/cardiolipin synthase-like enzyme